MEDLRLRSIRTFYRSFKEQFGLVNGSTGNVSAFGTRSNIAGVVASICVTFVFQFLDNDTAPVYGAWSGQLDLIVAACVGG